MQHFKIEMDIIMIVARGRSIVTLGVVATALVGPVAIASSSGNTKIEKWAVTPYTQKGYPSFYATWGSAGMKKINSLLPLAAEKAAASPECDRVDLVELSQQRSTPGKKIVLFADCKNGKRFYIDEASLASKETVKSKQSKTEGLDNTQAAQMCDSAIKAKLNNPLTYNRQATSTAVYRAPSTGNVVVEFKFEAKNDLGGVLPHKARCVFTDRGIEEAMISKS